MGDITPIVVGGGAIALIASLTSKKKPSLPDEALSAIKDRAAKRSSEVSKMDSLGKLKAAQEEAQRIVVEMRKRGELPPVDPHQKLTMDRVTSLEPYQKAALEKWLASKK